MMENKDSLYEILENVTQKAYSPKKGIGDISKAKYIIELLKPTGWQLIKQTKFSLIYSQKELNVDNSCVLVSSHIDTEEDITSTFCNIKENNIVGTFDNSLTNAGILYNMIYEDIPKNVIVAFTGNEECGMDGARDVINVLADYKINNVIVLDVTYDDYFQYDFTFDNFSHSQENKLILNESIKNITTNYIYNNPVDDDETYEYRKFYDCMSFCIPTKGDMHSNVGVETTKDKLYTYVKVLKIILSTKLQPKVIGNNIIKFLTQCSPVYKADSQDWEYFLMDISNYENSVHWEINAGINERQFLLANELGYSNKIVFLTDYSEKVLNTVRSYYDTMDTDDNFEGLDYGSYDNLSVEEVIPFRYFDNTAIEEISNDEFYCEVKSRNSKEKVMDEDWHGALCRVEYNKKTYTCIYMFLENYLFLEKILLKYKININSLCGIGIRDKSGSFYDVADTNGIFWKTLKDNNVLPKYIAFKYSSPEESLYVRKSQINISIRETIDIYKKR